MADEAVRATLVTVTMSGVEELAAKLAGVVGVKVAVSESAPAASAVVTQVATPVVALKGEVQVIAVVPDLKAMVPAAAGETVAVSVTLVLIGAVAIGVVVADVNAADSVVVVSADTAKGSAVLLLAA